MITPVAPRPAPEPQPVHEPIVDDIAAFDAPFVPPQAERVPRAPRMPRVEDLPMPAQNQLRAQRSEQEVVVSEQKRLGLLHRLATVGFGRREEPAAPAPAPVQQRAPEPAPRPAEAAQRPGMSPVHAEYAKRPAAAPQGYRPAQGQLDPHGRPPAPAPRAHEDDQLEIPAFLRRQAN
jgi:cell division protein FtsZ